MRLQIAASIDYAHGSWLTTKFTGALNYQIAHHLFPNVAQEHYPRIAPIIMRVCDEFGVKYTVKASLWDAIGGHLGLLYVDSLRSSLFVVY
jgi:linoleoyl-CoA desaturase